MQEKIFLLIIALAVGLFGGYLIFGGAAPEATAPADHDHAAESAAAETTWTCSMHPQIRQPEPGDCPICGMDLIPLAETGNNDPAVFKMTEAAVALANVQTTVIGRGGRAEASDRRRLSGKVQADERRAASQVAHVPGRIERLYVSFTGEQVRRGQRLADIYSPELITAQRELLEARKLREVNPGLLAAARDKLRYWKIDSATIARIEQSGTLQEVFPLFADATGIVTARRVAVGDYVQRGEPLFELVDLSRVWVLFAAYEDDLRRIAVGDRIEFTTPALPAQTFTTRVTFLDPVLDPETRTAAVRTEVTNPRGTLKPEMLVYGTLLPERAGPNDLLTVPKSAVLWTGTRSVVYVKIPDATVPSFEFREVTLGESRGDSYVVTDGLAAGEAVVTYGNFAIDAAAQLNNQMSMMNRMVNTEESTPEVEVPSFVAATPEPFQRQLTELVGTYLPVKDALVASDPTAAAAAATDFVTALDGVDLSLVAGDAHAYGMEQLRTLRAHGRQLSGSDDLDAQRQQFELLSAALINSLRAFGAAGDTVYVQHCPMAFNDRGADWIASEAAIRNPYFGDQMLTCGFVEDTIE
jgi:Cu(I)/Ag(I) efflux system membrane fusion protein